jgi:electron transport complex protein RnfB
MTTAIAFLLISLIAAIAGGSLAWLSAQKPKTRRPNTAEKKNAYGIAENSLDDLIEAVNEKLPQTQCAQCGYPGCRPYASAIIESDAPINQCPPGGLALIQELSEFLGKEAIDPDPNRGYQKPEQVAVIIEPDCIGCTLCIAACPVDAIVGASRLMHTVISDHCTGCELCLPPCPVDCIELIPIQQPLTQWHWPKPA